MKKRHAQRRGIAHIWTAIFLLVFVGFLGLATDTAWVVLVKQQLQNAADASALAAAAKVRASQDDARDAAVDLAFDYNRAASDPIVLDPNTANLPEGDVVIGRYNRTQRTFTPGTSAPNAVKVVARRIDSTNTGLPLVFGPVFGVETADVTGSAIAMVGGGTGSGIIALDPNAECSLSVGGTATLEVNGGAIQVNSSSDGNCPNRGAFCTHGNPIINAPEINVTGGACVGNNTTIVPDPDVVEEYTPPVPDPLAQLPEPPTGSLQNPVGGNVGTLTIQPGYYPEGIMITGGDLTMMPGIYFLEGVGFQTTGGNITANNVLLYIKRGKLDLRGNGNITISAPDPNAPNPWPGSDIYEYVSIFQARDNPTPSSINGGNNLDLQGTLYFPNNHIVLNGTGDGFGTQLIANTIEVTGTGVITIVYEGQFPGPGNRIFLVE